MMTNCLIFAGFIQYPQYRIYATKNIKTRTLCMDDLFIQRKTLKAKCNVAADWFNLCPLNSAIPTVPQQVEELGKSEYAAKLVDSRAMLSMEVKKYPADRCVVSGNMVFNQRNRGCVTANYRSMGSCRLAPYASDASSLLHPEPRMKGKGWPPRTQKRVISA
jgi:hypothetical protein